jgi:hypothetical protein
MSQPGTDLEWFYGKAGQQFGPVPESTLRAMLQRGELTPQDLVWRNGLAQWAPIEQVLPLAAPAPFAPAPIPGPNPWQSQPASPYGTAAPNPLNYGTPIDSGSTQKTLAILAIVFGSLGFICCPIIFGVGGIVCGAIAVNKPGPHGQLAKVGLIIAIVGTVLGVILGVIFALVGR